MRGLGVAAALAVGAAVAVPGVPAGAQVAQVGQAGTEFTAQDAVADPAEGTGTAAVWENPQSRSTEPDRGIRAQVVAQSPESLTLRDTLQLTVQVTNSSDRVLTDLQLRPQRQEALGSAPEVGVSLLANEGEYPWVGEFSPVPGTRLAPGDTVEVPLSLPVADLGIGTAGVYPLLVNLNGNLGGDGSSYLSGARTTLTVRDDSAGSAGSSDDKSDSTDSTAGSAPFTLLWPLAARTTVTPAQVGDAPDPATLYLSDDSLAGELGEGGRLRDLLDTYRDAVADHRVDEATCLAVDPALLQTVQRMTRGYRVAAQAPSPVKEPTRLRDRWTHHDDDGPVADGSGKDAAASWLSDLTDVVSGGSDGNSNGSNSAARCVVPLPWGGADPSAVAATGDPRLTGETMTRGTQTIEEVLGVQAARGVVVPGSGYIDPDVSGVVLPGQTTVVNDTTTTADSGGDATTAPVVDLPDGARALRYPAALGSALAATGTAPSTAAYSDPWMRRHLSDDGPAGRMAAAVAVLDLEIDRARRETGAGSGDDSGAGSVLAVPPAEWTVDGADARTWLAAVTRHLSDGSARPQSFGDALTGASRPGTATAPGADPAAVDAGEIRHAAQLAGHITDLADIMSDDPNIALTRTTYTRPIFDDLLRALSDTRRRVADESAATRSAEAGRMDRVGQLVHDLRTSVSLLPPGNVFARASDSSPLLVVARNGLPLPVKVRVDYSSAPGVALNTPGVQQIPAQGSVTLQMTTDIPDDLDVTDLTMQLSTPDDVQISDAVTVRVTSAHGVNAIVLAVAAAVVVALAGVATVVWRRRRFAKRGPGAG
jgi:hypothetical protein